MSRGQKGFLTPAAVIKDSLITARLRPRLVTTSRTLAGALTGRPWCLLRMGKPQSGTVA